MPKMLYIGGWGKSPLEVDLNDPSDENFNIIGDFEIHHFVEYLTLLNSSVILPGLSAVAKNPAELSGKGGAMLIGGDSVGTVEKSSWVNHGVIVPFLYKDVHEVPSKNECNFLDIFGRFKSKIGNVFYGSPSNTIMVGSSASHITFTDDEIPHGERDNSALYVSGIYKGYVVDRLVVDNGSAFNVIPFSTLLRLRIDVSSMQQSDVVALAYDGTARRALGKIKIPLKIGPKIFEPMFEVMNINASYNGLLGRPWIHMAGAVASTLHQKVKFRVNGEIVTVEGDGIIARVNGQIGTVEGDDIMVVHSSDALSIGVPKEVLECSCRFFEIIEAKSEIAACEKPTSQALQMKKGGLMEKLWVRTYKKIVKCLSRQAKITPLA